MGARGDPEIQKTGRDFPVPSSAASAAIPPSPLPFAPSSAACPQKNPFRPKFDPGRGKQTELDHLLRGPILHRDEDALQEWESGTFRYPLFHSRR